MKLRIALLLGFVLLLGSVARANDDPKIDVYAVYSYLRFNPTLNYLNNRSFSGGGGGVQLNFGKYLGIKGEFMGYGSTTFTIPAGTYNIPKLSPNPIVLAAPLSTQGNMFDYLFGPVVSLPISRIKPFGQILFGGSNSNAYLNQITSICNNFTCVGSAATLSGTQHPFTMEFGGGLDIKLSPRISFRPIDIGWVLTRFTNPLTSTNNQNSFRYSAGIVFHF